MTLSSPSAVRTLSQRAVVVALCICCAMTAQVRAQSEGSDQLHTGYIASLTVNAAGQATSMTVLTTEQTTAVFSIESPNTLLTLQLHSAVSHELPVAIGDVNSDGILESDDSITQVSKRLIPRRSAHGGPPISIGFAGEHGGKVDWTLDADTCPGLTDAEVCVPDRSSSTRRVSGVGDTFKIEAEWKPDPDDGMDYTSTDQAGNVDTGTITGSPPVLQWESDSGAASGEIIFEDDGSFTYTKHNSNGDLVETGTLRRTGFGLADGVVTWVDDPFLDDVVEELKKLGPV